MGPEAWLAYLPAIIGGAIVVSLGATWGWVHTTKLKIQHGYPLEGMWGQSLKPTSDRQSQERITLLTQENAALRAELGSLKDRMATVERIVTDSGYRLSHEIDALRDTKGPPAQREDGRKPQ